LSDLALRSRIIQALAHAPRVDVAEIAVECDDDGDVVLRGSVVNMLQRAEAVRTTRHVPGVRAVDDELRTRPVGAAHRADAETEAAVLDALILDDAVPAYGIDVDVDRGRVTLCGAVDVGTQRDAAERIALRVSGVSEVRNRLNVWPAVSAEDVAERVTDAIGVDAIVGADEITVTVRDDVVTLSGSVRSGEDRDAAVAAAAHAGRRQRRGRGPRCGLTGRLLTPTRRDRSSGAALGGAGCAR
jgi:osmotically-inducible protein OsmY